MSLNRLEALEPIASRPWPIELPMLDEKLSTVLNAWLNALDTSLNSPSIKLKALAPPHHR
jgi:hypothetical protein